MNIYQKLIEVRKAVPYLQKDKKGAGFNYVSSSDTLGALKSKMDELSLLLIPSIESSELRDHTNKSGGHQYFTWLKMTFTWIDAEKPADKVVSKWEGQGLDTGEKGLGKALTYAEKYFLLKFFNIPTDQDDPDSFNEKHAPETFIDGEQQKTLTKLLQNAEADTDKFFKFFNAVDLPTIPSGQYKKAIAMLEGKIASMAKEVMEND